MVAVHLTRFGGMVPVVEDTLLPDTSASYVSNAWLYSGAVEGFRKGALVRTLLSPAAAYVYRIPLNYTDWAHLDASTWLEFEDRFTNVIRTPVIGDVHDRYYWASPSSAAQYNTAARITAGNPAYVLGIPAPATPPSVVPTGGTTPTVARAYVYTWVSSFGEEGPPSEPTLVTANQTASWAITMTAPTTADTTNRSLATVRIYRTITASNGVATYFFVAEQAIGDTTYTDTLTDAVVAGQGKLESTNWSAPPSDLEGWTSMPNGIVAGWKGKEIWFSEPYRPHAWPPGYAIAVDFNVVGLGVLGQSLVVCTEGYPAVATGVHPSAMTLSTLAALEPCTSRGSVVSRPEGVYYASPNGLVRVASGVAMNITKKILDRAQWQAHAPVTTLNAVPVGDSYFGFGTTQSGVFQTGWFEDEDVQSDDYTGSYRGVLIDSTDERVAFTLHTSTVPTTNMFQDAWTGDIFYIRDGDLYRVDFSAATPEHEVYKWRSKLFQPGQKKNFGAFKVYFTIPSTTPPQSAAPNTALVQTLATDQYGLVRVYADGVHVVTRELRTSGEQFRIPSGFKADQWQFEIEARVKITSFQVASTPRELRGV